jgi:hypothetical protein
MLKGLKGLGSKAVVLTGVSFEDGLLGAACIDAGAASAIPLRKGLRAIITEQGTSLPAP